MTALIIPIDPLSQLVSLVSNAVSSAHSKRAYSAHATEFLEWLRSTGHRVSRAALQAYRTELEARKLASSSINVRLAAIKALAREAHYAGLLNATEWQAIREVKGAPALGRRLGAWLSRDEAERLLGVPDRATLRGKRDYALLCVLLGCGLRRTEAAGLSVSHIQQREGRWVIVDLHGKGGRVRSVPMPIWAKLAIDEWTAAAGIVEGFVFRSLHSGLGAGLSAQAVYTIVVEYAGRLGLRVAAHDLRRTSANLALKGGASIEQISLVLGHANITTTQNYLGVKLDLVDAVCDFIPLATTPVRRS